MSETGFRLAAVVGAVGMVAVAFVARDRLDDNGGGGNGDEGDDSGTRTLVCPPELEDVCRGSAGDDLEIRIEDALTTADALTAAVRAGDVEGDLWLVPAVWVQAVAAERERLNLAPVVGEATPPVARSPITLVVLEDAAAPLEAGICEGDIDWRCVGDAAEQNWDQVGGQGGGQVEAGLVDPASGSGLAVLGSAVSGYLGTPDYASNDFDGGLSNWLRRFAGNAPKVAEGDPVTRMLTRGRGEFAAVGAPEWNALNARIAVEGGDVRVLVPEPIATVDLVVVPIGNDLDTDATGDLAGDDDLLDALAEMGWRVPDRDLADGLNSGLELPDDDGLPSGDVLRVLLTNWLDLL